MEKPVFDQSGFSLLEAILSVVLVVLMINALFLAWYVAQTREQSLDQYWQAKEELEVAYIRTFTNLRGKARTSTVAVINSGQGISFTEADGTSWQYNRIGNDFVETCAGVTETLISGRCNQAGFIINGNKVRIILGVTPPPAWNGANDLNIDGTVYIRNN